jgi:hypothetical protein
VAEPLSAERLEEITEQAADVVAVFGDDWYLVYDPDADEVSARTDEGAPPFEGSYTPVFETSQWPEGSPRSPLAEFLASSIVVVPELLGEVERLRADVDDLRGQNAKTEDNFTSYAETVAMELARLRGMNARLHTALEQVRLLSVQPDLIRLVEKALGEGTAGPAAYVNGDNGTTLCCLACDGHIAHIDPGDDFDRLDAERRAHVCESGGKP